MSFISHSLLPNIIPKGRTFLWHDGRIQRASEFFTILKKTASSGLIFACTNSREFCLIYIWLFCE